MFAVIFLMGVYVIFGGALGAGMVGILKTILLYVSTIVCGLLSLKLGGGLEVFREALPAEQYFNLFARGYWKDGGAGASLVFGVLTTQAYILPVISAKDLKTSKAGALLGGVLTVVIGIAGIFVGMYMKLFLPDIPSSAAMPQFVIHCVPGFLGGVILATLLIAIIGTGAGLALGISSMVSRDIYKVYFRPQATDRENLRFSRLVILAVLLSAALFSMGEVGSMILNWSFLSMGLRGAVAFAPMCFALFSPGRIGAKFAGAAMVCGPVLVLVGSFILPPDIDPLFLGMAGSGIICFMGWLLGKKPAA
jgi:SSS family solute:Na+ symporter